MPTALALIPGTMLPRRINLGRVAIDVHTTASRALDELDRRPYDLLILGPMEGNGQSDAVAELRAHRRARVTPILFLVAPESLGIVIPRDYRPGVDTVIRGHLESPAVHQKVVQLIGYREGDVEPLLVGNFELDPGRRRLRFEDGEIALTRREAELLAILMGRPNETVTSGEILESGWAPGNDPHTLQTLRRHVSNLRQKLDNTPAQRALHTVRGEGYRFVSRTG
ncbi:MAG TPA: winged helix-turn-helix domain-containing protein [Tepidiformaceae bacterium]|nr:winged helix-turn-helix domain-containing protein [Tepidiformaceae bacterium]